MLLDDDCYLPTLKRESWVLCRQAEISGSGRDLENVLNGIDRSLEGKINAAKLKVGENIALNFSTPQKITSIRLVFDSDLTRNHLNMRSNYRLADKPFAPPATLVKSYHITANGVEIFRKENNCQRFNSIAVDLKDVSDITLHIDSTWGKEEVLLFSFDVN